MSRKSLSSVERRARAILDAYGSSPANWPAEERQQAQECIAHSATLQAYQAQLATFDRLIQCELNAEQAQSTDHFELQQRILHQVGKNPVTTTDAQLSAFWQCLHHWLVAPRLIATLSVIALVAMILFSPNTHQPVMTAQALDSYEAWSWYDITGQELATVSDSTAMTMTDFIDLETGDDGG